MPILKSTFTPWHRRMNTNTYSVNIRIKITTAHFAKVISISHSCSCRLLWFRLRIWVGFNSFESFSRSGFFFLFRFYYFVSFIVVYCVFSIRYVRAFVVVYRVFSVHVLFLFSFSLSLSLSLFLNSCICCCYSNPFGLSNYERKQTSGFYISDKTMAGREWATRHNNNIVQTAIATTRTMQKKTHV